MNYKELKKGGGYTVGRKGSEGPGPGEELAPKRAGLFPPAWSSPGNYPPNPLNDTLPSGRGKVLTLQLENCYLQKPAHPHPWSTAASTGQQRITAILRTHPPMQEMQVQSLGWEDPLRRKWLPTPVFSCLGNVMDRGAQQATGRGTAKSWTRLGD